MNHDQSRSTDRDKSKILLDGVLPAEWHYLLWRVAPPFRLCEFFGVSDNAVRKRCRRLGVQLPNASYSSSWALPGFDPLTDPRVPAFRSDGAKPIRTTSADLARFSPTAFMCLCRFLRFEDMAERFSTSTAAVEALHSKASAALDALLTVGRRPSQSNHATQAAQDPPRDIVTELLDAWRSSVLAEGAKKEHAAVKRANAKKGLLLLAEQEHLALDRIALGDWASAPDLEQRFVKALCGLARGRRNDISYQLRSFFRYLGAHPGRLQEPVVITPVPGRRKTHATKGEKKLDAVILPPCGGPLRSRPVGQDPLQDDLLKSRAEDAAVPPPAETWRAQSSQVGARRELGVLSLGDPGLYVETRWAVPLHRWQLRRDLAMVALVACYGVLPGEITELTIGDWTSCLNRPDGVFKSVSSSGRATPLPAWLRSLISDYVATRPGPATAHERLFVTNKGEPCYRELVGMTVTRLCRVAGIPAASPRRLRDNACRELLAVACKSSVALHMGFTRSSHVNRLIRAA